MPRLLRMASLLFLAGCTAGAGGSIPMATATLGPFDVVLAVSGELEAVRSVTVSTPELGRSAKVTFIVEDGTRVKEGDVLVEFDRSELLAELEDEESKLEVATTKISQNEAQFQVRIADLADALDRARLDLERARMRVTDSEAIPRLEREGARLDVAEAELALARANKALEAARLQGEAELELLRIEARRAGARVQEARERLSRTTIKAPSEGLVIKQEIWNGGKRGAVQAGDTVWRGTQLLELPDLSAMQVEAWVHEVDAGRVAVGQPVEVRLDAFPDPPHQGQVERLADLAVEREDGGPAKYLRTTISLPEVLPVMKPGMTVRAEIQVEHLEAVLSIPLEAVRYEGLTTLVDRRAGAGWEATEISLGPANDTHVVVQAGIEAGDEVALVDPRKWAEGNGGPVASRGDAAP